MSVNKYKYRPQTVLRPKTVAAAAISIFSFFYSQGAAARMTSAFYPFKKMFNFCAKILVLNLMSVLFFALNLMAALVIIVFFIYNRPTSGPGVITIAYNIQCSLYLVCCRSTSYIQDGGNNHLVDIQGTTYK
jgi:energy-coupling factor transporter transmembrane protein EcfT